MVAKRAGETVRWRVVVGLEVVKAVLRVGMGRASGGRPVVGTGVGDEGVERRMTTTLTDGESAEGGGSGPDGDGFFQDGEWKMPRTGMRLPPLPSSGGSRGGEGIADFLEKRVIGADEIKSANRLVRQIVSVQGQVAELMWALRPILYALALQRCRANKRDWRPWLFGLAVELTARQLAKKDIKEGAVGGFRGLSGVEREELKRRGWGLAWWGMRGAFYENITRAWIHGFAGKLKGKPLLDMVGVIVEDFDYLWDEYYFPTATL